LESDVLIFTLGLTEAWKECTLGHTLPLAPGVAGGDFDPQQYTFENFTFDSIKDDLQSLVTLLSELNPSLKFLFTVSPVSLKATYEKRNVLISTQVSKSRLRIAIDCVVSENSNCEYFPSYEIVTAPWGNKNFFSSDRREVNQAGVRTVMEIFLRTMLESYFSNENLLKLEGRKNANSGSEITCDEALISPQYLSHRPSNFNRKFFENFQRFVHFWHK
jgi:hypothetical protein